MNTDTNFYRLLIIDDNPAIHDDFRKVLTMEQSASSDLEKEEAILFGDEQNKEEQKNQTKTTFSTRYEIDSALQGEEGYNHVTEAIKEKRPYALAFIDIRMPPGWDGIETTKRILEVDPYIQIVICTAYSDYSWGQIIDKLGETDRFLILKKPFDNVEIRQMAASLTYKWSLNQKVRHQMEELEAVVTQRTAQLTRSVSLSKATLEATTDGILVVNTSDKIVDYNEKFIKMWELDEALLKSDNKENQSQKIKEALLSQLEESSKLMWQRHKTKNVEFSPCEILKFKDARVFEQYSQPQWVANQVVGTVWSFRDITDRVRAEKQLEHQATHDLLTGLPNRALLLDRMQQAILESSRSHKKLMGILFLDLDNFKLVNDSLGHPAGDTLLQEVAKRLSQAIRSSDTLARLGGDEFVILANLINKEEEAHIIIKNIFTAFSKPFHIKGQDLNITTAIGISLYPKDGNNSEILLKYADLAMYRAKETGLNEYQFYMPNMNLRALARLELENDLRNAIEKSEFILHYQPLINAKTKEIVGVEALIRWQHPQRGLVMPNEFISIAEETGLIVPIGAWVIRTACAQAKKWHDQGIPLWMSVNVSSYQFKHGNIVQTVSKALEESGLEGKYFGIEITESLLLDNTSELQKTLHELKSKKISLILDDFGTGYSGLSYIHNFPMDRIKIDRSFVSDVNTNPNDLAVVLSIIRMARSLNMNVTAEGVERREQVELLESNKCTDLQGFYFSKPLDSEAFSKLLKEKFKK